MSRQAAVKCFSENALLLQGDSEEYNYYNGLANFANNNFTVAKRFFEENIRLFGQENNHKFNLYNGLWNLADSMEKSQ